MLRTEWHFVCRHSAHKHLFHLWHFVKKFKLVVQAVTHTTHPSIDTPTFKFLHVDEMSVGEILNVDKESVDKMSVDKESIDKMSVDKESVDR
jgi:hypothetical protein